MQKITRYNRKSVFSNGVSQLAISFAVIMAMKSGAASAQVTADGTAGTVVGAAGSDFTVSGGTIAGANQFHSFTDFSIPTGGSATFLDPGVMIDNVISRVTGGSVSVIDGALISNVPSANFFFINPNGVTFNQNASINVPAGFHVSTADELQFDNGDVLKADNGVGSTFSIAAPEAFGFLGGGIGDIVINGADAGAGFSPPFFSVEDGSQLSFVGGDISFDFGSVRVFDSSILFAAANGPGLVFLDGDIARHTVSSWGDISLNETLIIWDNQFGISQTGQQVNFRSGTFNLTDGKIFIRKGITGSAPDLRIVVDHLLLIDGDGDNFSEDISTQTEFFLGPLEGENGDIIISAGALSLVDSASIRTDTSGQILAGDIRIDVGGLISLEDDSFIGSEQTFGGATGGPGNIFISAGEIWVKDSSIRNELSFQTVFFGDLLNPQVTGAIEISITGDALFDNGQVATVLQGEGPLFPPASVSLNALGDVILQNGSLIQAQSRVGGNVGAISVNANALSILSGSIIIADAGVNVLVDTAGDVDGGDIIINVVDRLLIDPELSPFFTGISSGSGDGQIGPTGGILDFGPPSTGNGGDINITAHDLDLIDGGGISVVALESGNAGAIAILLTGDLNVHGRNIDGFPSVITSNSAPVAGVSEPGMGGPIIINANNVSVTNSGVIQSAALGAGDAGSIVINANDTILIDGLSVIPVQTAIAALSLGAGRAGDIALSARNVTIKNDAVVIANALGTGNAGNISIEAIDTFLVNATDANGATDSATGISTGTTGSAQGGNISIMAGDFILRALGSGFAVINSVTQGDGDAGEISINADSVLIEGAPSITVQDLFDLAAGIDPDVTQSEFDALVGAFLAAVGFANHVQIASASEGGAGAAGTIMINSKDNIVLNAGAITASTNGVGAAGDIFIQSGSLNIDEFGSLSTQTLDAGEGGAINIQISGAVNIEFGAIVATTTGVGGAGGIVIDAGSLRIEPFSSLGASTTGAGDAGEVSVTVDQSLQINGGGFGPLTGTGITTTSGTGDLGDAGSVEVHAGSIQIVDGGRISAATEGSGDAGSVDITAQESIDIAGEGSGIFSNSILEINGGAAGSVSVAADRINIIENGAISTESIGASGAATVPASVNVTARKVLSLDSGSISSATNGLQPGGAVTINTGELNMSNGAVISANTSGPASAGFVSVEVAGRGLLTTGARISSDTDDEGDAGEILITANGLELSEGAIVSSAASVSASGNAGAITIISLEIILDNGQITSQSFGSGDAGQIDIAGVIDLVIDNGGSITTTSAAGEGGDITINFIGSTLIVRNDGLIETAVLSGPGTAGDININNVDLVIFDNADIRTSADTGGGGAININASVIIPNLGILEIVENRTRVFSDPISFIDPSSTSGVSGAVVLGGLEGDVTAGVEELDESFLDASDVLDRRCAGARAAGAPSTLVQESVARAGRRPTDVAPAFYGAKEDSPLTAEKNESALLARAGDKACAATLAQN